MQYELTRKTVTARVDLSGVITPQQLLDQLLRTEVGNCDCAEPPSQQAGNSEQRELLLRLIEEYKAEIESKNAEIADAERLLEMRANLYLQLERLKNERARIEQNITAETQVLEQEHRVRMAGIGEGDCGYVAEEAQLLHLRDANDKLRLRLKDLLDYIARMEAYNNQLSHNHLLLTERARRDIPTRDYEADRVIERENLLRRMEMRAQEQGENNRRLDEQIRRQQAEAMASVRMQEEEIHRRNAARLGTLRANFGLGATAVPEPIPTSTFYQGTFPGGLRGEERGYYRQGVFFPDNNLYQGHP